MGERLHFFRLAEGSYVEIERNALFTFLTLEEMQYTLQQGELTAVTTMTEELRAWVRARKQ